MMQTISQGFAGIVPCRTITIPIARTPEQTQQALQRICTTDMQIHSDSVFNQGRYQVITHATHIRIVGPTPRRRYPQRSTRFPLVAIATVHPESGSNATSLRLKIRPQIFSILQLGVLGLPLILLLGLHISQNPVFPDAIILQLAGATVIGIYSVILLFFNIELNILRQTIIHELS